MATAITDITGIIGTISDAFTTAPLVYCVAGMAVALVFRLIRAAVHR